MVSPCRRGVAGLQLAEVRQQRRSRGQTRMGMSSAAERRAATSHLACSCATPLSTCSTVHIVDAGDEMRGGRCTGRGDRDRRCELTQLPQLPHWCHSPSQSPAPYADITHSSSASLSSQPPLPRSSTHRLLPQLRRRALDVARGQHERPLHPLLVVCSAVALLLSRMAPNHHLAFRASTYHTLTYPLSSPAASLSPAQHTPLSCPGWPLPPALSLLRLSSGGPPASPSLTRPARPLPSL